jgi:LPS O-antigen subunit length determinant protein (WzzB/FepE family)
MKNKYTVVTKNQEFNIIEVLHVEVEKIEEAFKVAVQQIVDQMITDSGELDEKDIQEVFENEELICILEGHCKCVLNGGCE